MTTSRIIEEKEEDKDMSEPETIPNSYNYDIESKKELLLAQTVDIFKMYAKFANPDHIDQKKNAQKKRFLKEEILKDAETVELIHQKALNVDTKTLLEQNSNIE